MPIDAQILSAQIQDGQLCLWAAVNSINAVEDRIILIRGTGHPHAATMYCKHIDTVINGPIEWHVFDETPPRED